MKKETDKTSARLGTRIVPTVNVQIRMRDQAREAVEAAVPLEGKEPGFARGWAVWTVLFAVWAIAGIYVGLHIASGWVPADDGILAQSALRVMQGQLPHRDFAEIYTGGLSAIHAVAFRIFGVSLISLRICAFLFFLAWVPAVYYIALRFTSAIAAGLITLVAVAWSFPNYPAAMPSWYNLFFATFGAAALLRYLDARKRRWLFVAGLCGGVSILIKVIGAYYIAGVLLFLAFLEQSNSQRDGTIDEKRRTAIPYRAFSAIALLSFMATVIYLFHARLGIGELYHFVLPPAAVVMLILLGERNVGGAETGQRFKGLLKLVIPFVSGVLSPIIAFLVPYAKSSAVGQFFAGVTASAIARSVGLGVRRPAPIEKIIFALALLGLVAAAMYWPEFQQKFAGAATAVALVVILLKARTSSGIVSGVWYSVAMLAPMVVLLGVLMVLAARKWQGQKKIQRQRAMVLVCLAAMCGLVQYPFAAPIYLCYSLPLTVLAGAAIVATAKKQPGNVVLASVAGFYLVFGVVVLVPDHVYELTHQAGRMDELRLERAGGLKIEYAPNFADLIHFLQQHSPNGLMYAGNDCPELYFLSGLKNVTRDDGGASATEVWNALQSDDLKLVVINEAPFFPSARISPDVRAEVELKFPESRQVGLFHVFWRQ